MVAFVGPKGSKRARPVIPGLPPLAGWFLDQIDKHTWLQHIMSSNPIIDGDTLFMHASVSRSFSNTTCALCGGVPAALQVS